MATSKCPLNARSCYTIDAKLTEVRGHITPARDRPLGDVVKACQSFHDLLTSAADHKIRHFIAHGMMDLYREICLKMSLHLRGLTQAPTAAHAKSVHTLAALQTQIFLIVYNPNYAKRRNDSNVEEDMQRLSDAGMLDITVALSACAARVAYDAATISQLCMILSRDARGRADRGVCDAIMDLYGMLRYTERSFAAHDGDQPWELLAELTTTIVGEFNLRGNAAAGKLASFLVHYSAQVPETEVTTLVRFVYGLARHYHDRNAVPPADFAIFGTVVRLVGITVDLNPKNSANLILAYVETSMQKYRGDFGTIPGEYGCDVARLAMRHRLEPRRYRVTDKAEREKAMWYILNICVVRCHQNQKHIDYLSAPTSLKILMEHADTFVGIAVVNFLARSEKAYDAFLAEKGPKWIIKLALKRRDAGSEGKEMTNEMPHFYNGRSIFTLLIRNIDHGSQAAVAKSTYVMDLLRTHLTSVVFDDSPDMYEWRPSTRKWADAATLIDFMAQTEEGCRSVVTKGYDLHFRLVGMIQFDVTTTNQEDVHRDRSDVVEAFRRTMSVIVSTALFTPASVVLALKDGFGDPGNITQTFVEFILTLSNFIVRWSGSLEPMFEACYAVSLILQAGLTATPRNTPMRVIKKNVLQLVSNFRRTLDGRPFDDWSPTFYNGCLCLSILFEYFPEIMWEIPAPDDQDPDVEWIDFAFFYCDCVIDRLDDSSEVARLARDVRKEIRRIRPADPHRFRTPY